MRAANEERNTLVIWGGKLDTKPVLRVFLRSAKGADARHHEGRNTPPSFRWPLDTASVLRVFLKSSAAVRALHRLNPHKAALLCEAGLFLAASKLLLSIVPFRLLSPLLGESMVESSQQISSYDGHLLAEVAWALKAIGRRLKWSHKCLLQAMAACWMLRRRRLDSTLYLGVRKDDADALAAHAWVRAGGNIVVGAETQPGFRVVGMFGTR